MRAKLFTSVILQTVILVSLIAFHQQSYAAPVTRYDACGTADAWWNASCAGTFEFENELSAAEAACSQGVLTSTEHGISGEFYYFSCQLPGGNHTAAWVKPITLNCGENQYPDFPKRRCDVLIKNLVPPIAEICRRILEGEMHSCGTNLYQALGPIPCVTGTSGVVFDKRLGDDTVTRYGICHQGEPFCAGYYYLGEHSRAQHWPVYTSNINQLREYCRNYKEDKTNKKEFGAQQCVPGISPNIGSE